MEIDRAQGLCWWSPCGLCGLRFSDDPRLSRIADFEGGAEVPARVDEPVRLPARARLGHAVRDDGSGIAPEIRARLFAAFATTKPHVLGLGLAISRTIVEAHGGRIWLESSDESGTEFRFTLPVAEERR
jgi:signal transduction histidine kinase